MLPGLDFANVREASLAWIWHESDGFNRFRGTAWMKEPCRSCDQAEVDLGGCRCQAFLLAGDATAADPVCPKSPHHGIAQQAVAQADLPPAVVERPLIFRGKAESLAMSTAASAAPPSPSPSPSAACG
jgi:PqqA peptide cyclase